MSFQIKLQTNASLPNERNKSLTDLLTLTGELRSESSIIDPVIMFEVDSLPANLNYMTIPVFGRSYFVTDIVSTRTNIIEVHAHVDVLSSAVGLENCEGIVRRQENEWNLYLDDGVFRAYSNPNVVTKAFPSGFSSSAFVLAVAGS